MDARLAMIVLNADIVNDLEAVRIANANRIGTLERDPETGGKGIDTATREIQNLHILIDGLERLEKDAVKNLERSMKDHPLGAWVAGQHGLGLKTVARFLGAVGDPADRETVSQLWAYCGYHVIDGAAPRRAKGQRANWSTVAKTRAYVMAECCIKQAKSPYRAVYNTAKAKHLEAVHTAPCVICGGAGKPSAAIGSPLRDGHKHARAMRETAKAIIRDIWIECRRARGVVVFEHGAQTVNATQDQIAA